MLLTGCSVFASTPVVQDPNAGGGKAQPEQESGGGIAPPGAGSENAVPGAVVAGIEMQPLAPGESFQRGDVTFWLRQVELGPSSTVLHWQVSGRPAGSPPTAGEFLLQMPDGAVLKAVGAEGGATGDSSLGESGEVTFPVLSGSARSFVLIIPNGWSGASETWRVPVTLP